MKRHYYAQTDTFTGDDPHEPNAGFANTKIPLAFRSRKDRDEWVTNTKLLTAKAITRREAISVTTWEKGEYFGTKAERCKPVRIYGTDADYVILAESAN